MVYPRVGGGNQDVNRAKAGGWGLSPRGRGKRPGGGGGGGADRSIPAWAGETPTVFRNLRVGKVYPRVGGGNGAGTPRMIAKQGLSPRGRGKRPPLPMAKIGSGSIPAWAGETSRGRPGIWLSRVYPRVGGGNPPWSYSRAICCGLSPRGRGKPHSCHRRQSQAGSIPAWAGETGMTVVFPSPLTVYPRVGGGNSDRATLPG